MQAAYQLSPAFGVSLLLVCTGWLLSAMSNVHWHIFFEILSACNWANLKIYEVLGCELRLMGCSEHDHQ